MVSITDGHENASSEYTLATVKQLIAAHTLAGWTFVFLGAALDVYGEAGGLGYDSRSTQSFYADGEGSARVFESLSRSTSSLRRKVRHLENFDKSDFFEGDKPAEDDRNDRGGS